MHDTKIYPHPPKNTPFCLFPPLPALSGLRSAFLGLRSALFGLHSAYSERTLNFLEHSPDFSESKPELWNTLRTYRRALQTFRSASQTFRSAIWNCTKRAKNGTMALGNSGFPNIKLCGVIPQKRSFICRKIMYPITPRSLTSL